MDRIEPESMFEMISIILGYNEDWIDELRFYHAQTHSGFNAWWNANAAIERAMFEAGIDPTKRGGA